MEIPDEDKLTEVDVIDAAELVTEAEELEVLLVKLLLVETKVEVLVAEREVDEDFEVLEITVADEIAVDEIAVDEIAVDEIVVDETAVELRAYNCIRLEAPQ